MKKDIKSTKLKLSGESLRQLATLDGIRGGAKVEGLCKSQFYESCQDPTGGGN